MLSALSGLGEYAGSDLRTRKDYVDHQSMDSERKRTRHGQIPQIFESHPRLRFIQWVSSYLDSSSNPISDPKILSDPSIVCRILRPVDDQVHPIFNPSNSNITSLDQVFLVGPFKARRQAKEKWIW